MYLRTYFWQAIFVGTECAKTDNPTDWQSNNSASRFLTLINLTIIWKLVPNLVPLQQIHIIYGCEE